MNWVDIAIIAVIAGLAFGGLTSGLIREAFGLVGLVLAVYAAGLYYASVSDIFAFLPSPETARIVAFVAVFAAVLLVVQILSTVVKQAANLLFLGWLDSLGGAAFGAVKGFLFVEFLLIAVTRFPILDLGRFIADSKLAPLFLAQVPVLLSLLPKDFDMVRRFFP